jgi:hypothetical protein
VIQGYLFGELQGGYVDDDCRWVFHLMSSSPALRRGRRYKLRSGGIVEISGILHQPAPKERQPPGPSFDFFYWLEGREQKYSEAEMLDMLESTKPELGGKCAPRPKKPGCKPRKAR